MKQMILGLSLLELGCKLRPEFFKKIFLVMCIDSAVSKRLV